MPTISRFYGMIVKMYFQQAEHNPPHIHVIYNEYTGAIAIQTGEMIDGDLPNKALKMAQEWTAIHKSQLMEIWETQKFIVLPPLM
jgi:hypothetical protein